MTARKNGTLRPSRPDELGEILEIINAAAQAYRGVIPPDQQVETSVVLADEKWFEAARPEARLDYLSTIRAVSNWKILRRQAERDAALAKSVT